MLPVAVPIAVPVATSAVLAAALALTSPPPPPTGTAAVATAVTSVGAQDRAGGTLHGEHRPPLPGAVVLAAFRAPPQRWAPGHRGVDLAAQVGVSVRAPAAGVVSFSGWVVDRSVITLTHPDGLRTSLEPVEATVAVGTAVAAGDVVGVVQDASSHCRPVCLHWGVRRGEAYLDPLDLLPGGGPVVLLPDR